MSDPRKTFICLKCYREIKDSTRSWGKESVCLGCLEDEANLKAELTCTRCRKIVETYSDIVYSQGSRVCLECKEITNHSDKRAFDRDMALRKAPQLM